MPTLLYDEKVEGVVQILLSGNLQQHFQVIDTNERLDSWRISASFGICDTQTAGVQLSELLNAADMALYQAKRAGKQQAVIYQPANNAAT